MFRKDSTRGSRSSVLLREEGDDEPMLMSISLSGWDKRVTAGVKAIFPAVTLVAPGTQCAVMAEKKCRRTSTQPLQ